MNCKRKRHHFLPLLGIPCPLARKPFPNNTVHRTQEWSSHYSPGVATDAAVCELDTCVSDTGTRGSSTAPDTLGALNRGAVDAVGSCFRISSRTVALIVSSKVVNAFAPAEELPVDAVGVPRVPALPDDEVT